MSDSDKPKTALEVLKLARQWQAEHEWTNGVASEARTKEGNISQAHKMDAYAFTPLGCLKRVSNLGAMDDWVTAASWLKLMGKRLWGVDSLYDINNREGQTKEGILQLFDATIARVQERESQDATAST